MRKRPNRKMFVPMFPNERMHCGESFCASHHKNTLTHTPMEWILSAKISPFSAQSELSSSSSSSSSSPPHIFMYVSLHPRHGIKTEPVYKQKIVVNEFGMPFFCFLCLGNDNGNGNDTSTSDNDGSIVSFRSAILCITTSGWGYFVCTSYVWHWLLHKMLHSHVCWMDMNTEMVCKMLVAWDYEFGVWTFKEWERQSEGERQNQ